MNLWNCANCSVSVICMSNIYTIKHKNENYFLDLQALCGHSAMEGSWPYFFDNSVNALNILNTELVFLSILDFVIFKTVRSRLVIQMHLASKPG